MVIFYFPKMLPPHLAQRIWDAMPTKWTTGKPFDPNIVAFLQNKGRSTANSAFTLFVDQPSSTLYYQDFSAEYYLRSRDNLQEVEIRRQAPDFVSRYGLVDGQLRYSQHVTPFNTTYLVQYQGQGVTWTNMDPTLLFFH